MNKYCIKCETNKDINDFGNNKNNKDKHNLYCKLCEKNRAKEYRLNNPDKQKESSEKWRKKNPEKQKVFYKKYIEKKPEMHITQRIKKYRESEVYRENEKKSRKEYYINNIDKEREKRKKYYYDNKEIERKKNNEWKKNKMKTDPVFRCKKNIRDRIRKYMKGENISERTFDIIGLSYDDFKKYIENQFTEGMSWENYGEWHVDHIKPLFLTKNKEDVLSFNNYNNLQPLWGNDNIKKNRKYDN